VARARFALSVASVLAVVELSVLLGPGPIRVAAGLTLGLVLPGLVLVRVIQSRVRVEGAERLALVPGMSIALAVITGLVLNALDVHLTTESWSIALGLVTAAGLVAVAVSQGGGWNPPRSGLRPSSAAPAAVLALAALAVAGALVVGVHGERDRGPGFTELWALPAASSSSAVQLGVRSHERRDARYRVLVSIDGRVVRSRGILLHPGQMWRSTEAVARRGEQLEVTLEKAPDPSPYRRVRLITG
jgi:uncharacterized membrane protein